MVRCEMPCAAASCLTPSSQALKSPPHGAAAAAGALRPKGHTRHTAKTANRAVTTRMKVRSSAPDGSAHCVAIMVVQRGLAHSRGHFGSLFVAGPPGASAGEDWWSRGDLNP